ncbi:MAG: O-acetyl-ADP-ribose deacetylase [Candidatus Methanoliparum thermophilum]|uniref:O-acetyl-ADP-ribose deacetylase n=1 Tax=Methanoliparum thermophilum TaxID=2491083 RepID=A0A520KUV5_METT2|nr:O-acetyl-ADP-ribose deacetylase [Candidatus Methanoliparum sp. LAM-1]RZN65481.1 MAG: O-acetyl-ADP-ribose deacetylase [Candidatus Methanoliparum thermophilum]BDC35428.1 O-acetyl-ADP-ribose deacetylase [Candidatus Methanoliparum sp. LAM-1]
MEKKIGKGIIRLKKGDITNEKVDAIVNAANSSLMGGGGVDGAIHRRGGRKILEECKEIVKNLPGRFLPSGKAVITSGGDLDARYVIHTVGPIWRGGKDREAETLRKCYISSLELGKNKGLKELSFPSISTGAFGYPIDLAAEVAINAVADFLKDNEMIVNFVLFDDRTFNAYKEKLNRVS